MYKALRGTTDIWGAKLACLRFIENTARRILSLYCYEEIITPVFEESSLFSRSIGEDTDVVQKEMYTFSDRKGRSITLRPEGTAAVARAVIEHCFYRERGIIKFFYFGPMFRYERPQAGRQRQFYHLGYEAIGSSDPSLDAEIIVLARQLFEELGLKNLTFRLNNLGCAKCRPVFRNNLEDYLGGEKEKLCPDCRRRSQKNIFRVLDCKNEGCGKIIIKSPKSIDFLCGDCRGRHEKLEKYLKDSSVPYTLHGNLVRGLDYYTGTVFEIIHPSLGAQDAVAGGGRYDNLIEKLGGPSLPAIGFACGVERLIIAMEKEGIPLAAAYRLDAYIIALGDAQRFTAFRLATELRKNGLNIEIGHGTRSLKAQMRSANKYVARFIVIIGEKEEREGTATVKFMEDGTQSSISQQEIFRYLKERAVK